MGSKKSRGRTAISTVVANMMMITITLSLAAILVAWAGTTYGLFSGTSQNFFQQKGQSIPERFVVENVFLSKSPPQLKIFVRNVGAQPLFVVAIYVNGTSFAPTESNSGSLIVQQPCMVTQLNNVWVVNETVGSVCEFDLTMPTMDPTCPPWCSGDIFNIAVASSRGNSATLTIKGP
jgi:hypothetical protein